MVGLRYNRNWLYVRAAHWRNGYAREAAVAVRDYAFIKFGKHCGISLIAARSPLVRREARKIGPMARLRAFGLRAGEA